MTPFRAVVGALLVTGAVLLQLGLAPVASVRGIVPDLALLVVVAAALTRSPVYATSLAFGAGLLLDLVPPADHVAGRWTIAFVVVAFLVSRVRHDAASSALLALATVAASAFTATSLFALSGLLLGDPAVPVSAALSVLPTAIVLDVLIAPFILPPVMALLSYERAETPSTWTAGRPQESVRLVS
ncbi:rod shape-determining protein MreD [Nocardioidaceae bacterium]|nr:rod shape-determining protein MreD [Nocardioidaceae bacterium]